MHFISSLSTIDLVFLQGSKLAQSFKLRIAASMTSLLNYVISNDATALVRHFGDQLEVSKTMLTRTDGNISLVMTFRS